VRRRVAGVTICSLCSLLFLGVAARAQTFEINGQQQSQTSAQSPGKAKAKASGKKSAPAQPSAGGGIGWGSSIEVGRMARAAEDALRKGNPAAAANYAQRAVQAAPQNSKLWFLLGYTSRLAGHYQQSIDAYHRGLAAEPNSVDGMSGLAQTYARMGNTAEAKRLLTQVVNSNPKRTNEMAILGELYLRTGETQQGLNMLQRAESQSPSAHTELMMAMAYLRMKDPAKAKGLLDRAKRRDPRNTDIFRAVANYYRETKDYASAINTLKSAPKMKPDVLADLAYTYELAGDKKDSAETYVRAANADPQNIGYQLSAAQAQFHLGDTEKARTFLQRAAAIDSNHYRLHAIRGAMAKQANQIDEAISEYNFGIAHLPESVPEGQLYPIQLRLNLSELYKDAGNPAAAQQQMRMAEEAINKIQVEGPAKAEFLRVRASIRAGSNDYAGAEADLKQAMALDPDNLNITLQFANLLWKMNRKPEAKNIYLSVLEKEPKNRYALEGLGYLARDVGDNKGAEKYFNRLAAAYPDDYVAYLALGDLYTATRDFTRAEASYAKAYKLAPKNAIVIANGANAAIEARKFELAKQWVDRATGNLANEPHVMLERERYLFHTGHYQEAAQLGQKVLKVLPKDRNASVYLAYALYDLGRYDDVLDLSDRYENILPKEPNFPLLAGHVHRQNQLLDEAVEDFSRALERDPRMVEGYVNRGYVENDLQNPQQAIEDFNAALKLNPDNGIAHLGLAFSDLQLRKGKLALDQADIAERLMGESGATHLARATAFRYSHQLDKAEKEYRVALKYSPDDQRLNLALADTLYHLRRYQNSLDALVKVARLSPDDPFIYAQMAHTSAHLHRRDQTLQYIRTAEQNGGDQSAVLLATGDALMTLGDEHAAMERFERALNAPDADRVDARMSIAKLFVRSGKFDDAKQQVALAFAESRIGEATPVTADNFIEAANILLAMNDFDLATRYYQKAKQAGAADEVVALGMANTYLAQGDPRNAQAELASLGNPADYLDNYDYQLAAGTYYRQRHDSVHALTAFAHANAMSQEDDIAERGLQEVAGDEGLRLNDRFSVHSDIATHAIFDDPTIYEMDARLFGITDPALLPKPRAPIETLFTNEYHFHQNGLPLISGFFQLRNAIGTASFPGLGIILNQDTYDYNFNNAINPVLRLGRSSIVFNTGVQFTLRRDHSSPIVLDQNLFRQFVNLSSSSFFNWVAIRGSAFHEAGPFTLRTLSSSDKGGRIEFIVGRPWGKTALITGYQVRDLQYNPLIREYFTTATYAGIQRQFLNRKLKASILGEYIRSWRVQDLLYTTAQAMRPAAEVEYRPNNRWSFDASFQLNRGEGFHSYDNVQSGFFISYLKPWRRTLQDATGEVPVEYPLRFSFGIQTQDFMNFAGRGQALIRPVIRLTLF
jgi:tetratricopeptide (TPR) repeat protein